MLGHFYFTFCNLSNSDGQEKEDGCFSCCWYRFHWKVTCLKLKPPYDEKYLKNVNFTSIFPRKRPLHLYMEVQCIFRILNMQSKRRVDCPTNCNVTSLSYWLNCDRSAISFFYISFFYYNENISLNFESYCI